MTSSTQATFGTGSRRRGARIDVEHLTKTVRGGITVLHDVTCTIERSELVAIVGGSGAGKTTLLEALAGVRPADSGHLWVDGVDATEHLEEFRTTLGYVPQDDIIHTELPLRATLRFAAQLRLPPDTPPGVVDGVVDDTMRVLDLEARADVRVGALSGGQRKRASIAVELLTHPEVFFLDEPTSGLDPATSAELLRVLRSLAHSGTTVVLTTHAVQDLTHCDRVVFLARGGHLAFVGTPAEALAYFEVDTIEAIYERLANDVSPQEWGERYRAHVARDGSGSAVGAGTETPVERRDRPGALRQWAVLTRRTFSTLTRNRLTLAILLGSPAMVVAMMAVLFRPGAFDFDDPSPSAIVMILFWVAFGAFFFGLTYGLLQICTEQAILRREHLVGLRLGPYLLSKLTVLLPFLVLVVVVMLGVLRLLDRLPAASFATYASIGVTLTLLAAASLALGLFASAAVGNPSQATLALPMLCFPAVLFSGAILPVHLMADVGVLISAAMPDRWAFEALGHDLGVRRVLEEGGSPLGPPLVESYGNAASYATGTYWSILAAFTAVFLAASWATLRRTCRRAER